ncbi:gliding motility protein GldM [Pedobacter sp. UBA4863]|uniref:type IX secretion system motor protein PorM/GldM n=1 Tax=Pedobacter sp. UBA4863 TaxID=1947060 RepID=UPI0025FC08FA|nr:gliding motility protein GldM [Pedobacter sp. UBA4863]
MAGGKETARQKMIGIMYLVLLAMLALNVSDLVLKAFKNINDSLNTSKSNVETNINQLLKNYESTKAKESTDNQVKLDRAKKAQNIAGDLIKYIDKLQQEIAKDGVDENGELVQKNNLDIGQNIMGGDANPKKGKELQDKINKTGKDLAALLLSDEGKPTFVLEAKNPVKPKAGEPRTWTGAMFGEGVPLVAFQAILTMLQNDAKNMEADIINKILADKPIVTLDQFNAVAVAPSSYVIQGQPYKAEIYLTASDSKSSPDVTVNGNKIPTENGKGVYTGGTGSVGSFKWVGTIRVKERNGSIKEYKTPEMTYQVAAPSASVSSDKLNVIYAGIPNPFTISAPGFPDVNASISGGSLSGSGGKYMVNVPGSLIGKEVTINVSGKNGTTTLALGTSKFRVKGIPDPVASFAGKKGGIMSANKMASTDQVVGELENFEFDLPVRVTKFTVTVMRPRQDPMPFYCTGDNFNSAAKAAIASLPFGSKVFIENVMADVPGRGAVALNSMVFTIN